MARRPTPLHYSPDPLALSDEHVADECIKVCSPTNGPPGSVSGIPQKPATPRRGTVKPIVEIPSPSKRKRHHSEAQNEVARVRTPLARASPSANRSSPTPNTKGRTKGKALVTPMKNAKKLVGHGSSISRSKEPTLASSLSKPLPTPSPTQIGKRVRLSSSKVEDAFTDPSPSSISTISRETFLANESLRRQREARKFIYTGDANAPKLTRSGRTVGEAAIEPDDGDEYGEDEEGDCDMGVDEDGVQEVMLPVAPTISLPTPMPMLDVSIDTTAKKILPFSARPHVLHILSTLTSQNIATNSPAFASEDANEALQGLVNLLKGTVERGEGNSALVVGARGAGKTRTIARALNLLPSTSTSSPVVVRLSGLAQTNDRQAIQEIGRQIAEAEGKKLIDGKEPEYDEGGEEDVRKLSDLTCKHLLTELESQEYAPTTLPSEILTLLTSPSSRAIIIVIEEFDLFTEHARQALLYCLLDVVQSIKPGPFETTGRGVAVIGVTSRVDTLLLLEKRVKSRFSHRMWRVVSPISADGVGWKTLMRQTLVPWEHEPDLGGKSGQEVTQWKGDWLFAIEILLEHDKVVRTLDRLCELTTDVRNLYLPFIGPIMAILDSQQNFLSIPSLVESVTLQVEGAGWGLQSSKLKGLPQPALGVLIIAKHLAYAGKEDFNFAQVEEEYLRFSRTKLVGSGKTRWPIGVLRSAFDHLLRLSLLTSAGHSTVKPQFERVRCTLSPHEVVAWFKGEGGNGLGPELASWGRVMGGHA